MITTVPSTIRAFLLPFARHYRANGWIVDAAACDISRSVEIKQEFDLCHDLPLSRNPFDVVTLVKAPSSIRELLAVGQYDLVHVHTPVAAFMVRFALRSLISGPRIVYTAHGFHFHPEGKRLKNWVFHLLEQIASRWCDAIVTINKVDYSAALGFTTPAKIRFIPGIGVDTARWDRDQVPQAERDIVTGDLVLPSGSVLILMVAEFIPRKRHQDALVALQKTDREDIHLGFVDVGPQLDAMKDLAKELGLSGQTHFLGFRRDVPALMLASRAVLLPSTHEGLPRSLLEAMSLGLPFIGSDIRGITELAEGGCGIVHKAGDIEALTKALIWIADHPKESQVMGMRAQTKVQKYSELEVIRLHDKLYSELLGVESI